MSGFQTPTTGIDRISQLIIDVDKDWLTRGITNIKQVAASMSRGDLVVRDNSVLVRIQAGPLNYVLTSTGPGKKPVWAPAGGALNYYFPAIIEAAHAEAVVPIDHSHNVNAALASAHYQVYVDTPADYIRRLDVAIALADAEAILAGPDQTIAKTAIPRSALSILCDGFVEETAGAVQTDHTAEARNATINDLNLNPMSDTVLDKIYIGSNYPFWQAQTLLSTTGVGNWTNAWYYWNGAWVPVVGENDGTNEWQFGTGLGMLSHIPQGDWVPCVIQGMNLYWVMSRTDNWVSRITKPLGAQIWVAIA